MDRTDFIARTAKALEGIDPESIDTFYIDRDGYEVEYWRQPRPDDPESLPRKDGLICAMRAIDRDWMEDADA